MEGIIARAKTAVTNKKMSLSNVSQSILCILDGFFDSSAAIKFKSRFSYSLFNSLIN